MAWWHCIAAVLTYPLARRQQKLMAEREGYSKHDFMSLSRSPDVASVLWDALSRQAVLDGFKPRPEDDIGYVFGLADDDLADMVVEMLQILGCEIPGREEVDRMAPVVTVADLVRFVEDVRALKGHQE